MLFKHCLLNILLFWSRAQLLGFIVSVLLRLLDHVILQKKVRLGNISSRFEQSNFIGATFSSRNCFSVCYYTCITMGLLRLDVLELEQEQVNHLQ